MTRFRGVLVRPGLQRLLWHHGPVRLGCCRRNSAAFDFWERGTHDHQPTPDMRWHADDLHSSAVDCATSHGAIGTGRRHRQPLSWRVRICADRGRIPRWVGRAHGSQAAAPRCTPAAVGRANLRREGAPSATALTGETVAQRSASRGRQQGVSKPINARWMALAAIPERGTRILVHERFPEQAQRPIVG